MARGCRTPPLPGMAGHDHGVVLGVSFNWMFRQHLFFLIIFFWKRYCDSGTLIPFVMNGWMSAQAVKSPPEKVCVPGCECNTVMLFHLFGKNIPAHLPQPPPPHPPLPPAVVCTVAKKTRRDSRCPVCWLECLLNVKGKGDKKNETETEWTLCRWILVKDASRVCDSVINLVKLRTEEPRQQTQRLLTEKRTQRSHFFAVPQNLKCIQMDSGGATVYITWMETYYHKIVMCRSLFFFFRPLQRSGIIQLNSFSVFQMELMEDVFFFSC